ncbi:MAG: hypothetical protein L7U56_03810 [Acidimicrobiales bacterium]|nr:hypothetical protein [Acidimicrobiales bacterium]
MAFRRPHPARRTRRLLGAACIVAYLMLGTVIGLSQRASDQADEIAASPPPGPTAADRTTAPTSVPIAAARFAPVPLDSAASSTTATTTVIPRPAPPPTTVLAAARPASPTTAAAPTPTATVAPPPATVAPPSTTAAPVPAPTTTAPPATTVPPSTTIYLGGS